MKKVELSNGMVVKWSGYDEKYWWNVNKDYLYFQYPSIIISLTGIYGDIEYLFSTE